MCWCLVKLRLTSKNSRNSLWFVKIGGAGKEGPKGGTDCSLYIFRLEN